MHSIFPIIIFFFIFLPINIFAEILPAKKDSKQFLISGRVIVDGKANIYGAGKTTPPSPAGGGGGILPFEIKLGALEHLSSVTFPYITGEVSCANSEDLYNNADGSNFCLGKTVADALGGLSGIKVNRTMFLAGVFLSDEEPQDPAPITFDLTGANGQIDSCDGYEGFSAKLNQVFFIGDGRSAIKSDPPYGKMQQINIPENASRLYLGFVDGDGTGAVGCYDDNLGELKVGYMIHGFSSSGATNSHPSIDKKHLLLYYSFDDGAYLKPDIEYYYEYDYGLNQLHNNLGDSSPFRRFHGVLEGDSEDAVVEFTTDNAKYNKAIKMTDAAIKLISSPMPLIDDWTIATWFMYNPEHPDFILYLNLTPVGGNHCRLPPQILITTNPSNNYELCSFNITNTGFNGICGTYETEYLGSGFYMNTLEEGWHHLAAVGTQEKIKFYLNGDLVGEAPQGTYSSFSYIKAYMLDDFLVYDRMLSQSEIYVLAERSDTPPEPSYTNECLSTLSDDGTLHIPCLSLPESFNQTGIYDVILEQQPDTFSFDLNIDNMSLK